MSLSIDVRVDRPGFRLEAALEVADGEVVAVLGPNGAGKTTLLRSVAGLEPLTRGRIVLGARTLVDTAEGIEVAVEARGVGVVFQDYLLFPHMRVSENVAFGSREGPGAWLDRLELADLADRYPADLSGGEAQRVALARALAAGPGALLLDEPLAALDVGSRHAVRTQLARHLHELTVPAVVVTHDPLDAALLADRMLILEGGRVTHAGTLGEVTSRPRSAWAARLAGVNLYRGRGVGNRVEIDGASLAVADTVKGPVFAVIAPHAVALHRQRPEGSPRNVWRGRLVGVEPAGSRIRVSVEGPLPIVAEVTTDAVDALGLRHLGEVWVAVKAAEIETYPA